MRKERQGKKVENEQSNAMEAKNSSWSNVHQCTISREESLSFFFFFFFENQEVIGFLLIGKRVKFGQEV